ncbi:hypothetical protein C8D88_116155 [Lentzea atacamensis]|uniref:N-acetylmuramoyl-L-alanine amidase n=1 Tax=Lentzea atacamensis TaxID=531938 RepID=A0A316HMF8_9PSEU|nr:hypothetical protein [Lentzea atacamensis]PWK81743.1 hypothetical protein C8D88_116155 [Lentzea atacamensis]
MSVDLTLKVVQVFREFAVPVTFEPGWERRGNGLTSAYKGGILHHTGTASASYSNPSPTTRILRDGRSDLPGPLCNFQGCFDGRVHVIAAHPANHAGASGGYNTAPLPVTRLFNPQVMGFEADYPGATPMSPELRKAALVYAVAMWRVFGSIQTLRAHAETSVEGKWDPGYASGRTVDMNAFRSEAVQLTAALPRKLLSYLEDPMRVPASMDTTAYTLAVPGSRAHKLVIAAHDKPVWIGSIFNWAAPNADGTPRGTGGNPKGTAAFPPGGKIDVNCPRSFDIPAGTLRCAFEYSCASDFSVTLDPQ